MLTVAAPAKLVVPGLHAPGQIWGARNRRHAVSMLSDPLVRPSETGGGEMVLPAAVAFGAVGGLIVEVIGLWKQLVTWQKACHSARSRGTQLLPPLSHYVTPGCDTLVAVTRIALGALAGLVFHSQVTGMAAAIAVGASAPALLQQLGATGIGELLQDPHVDSRLGGVVQFPIRSPNPGLAGRTDQGGGADPISPEPGPARADPAADWQEPHE